MEISISLRGVTRAGGSASQDSMRWPGQRFNVIPGLDVLRITFAVLFTGDGLGKM